MIVFLLIFFVNLVVRLPFITELGHLNDDSGMILLSKVLVENQGVLSRFLNSSAATDNLQPPFMLRPFQTLGTYFEFYVAQLSVFQSQIVSCFVLSAAQAILFSFCRRYIGGFYAVVAIFPLSFSLVSTEPSFWLSDRHDLYLVFVFALALFYVSRVIERQVSGWIPKLIPLQLCTLSLIFWLGFFCNEKATALPTIIWLWSILLLISKDVSVKALVRIAGIGAAVVFINTTAYFLHRKSIFGAFIGGYDNQLIDPGYSFISIIKYPFTIFSVPLFQEIQDFPFLVSVVATLFIGIVFFSVYKSRQPVLYFVLGLLAIIASSLPTLRYNLESNVIAAHSRWFWFPLIVVSLIYAFSLYAASKRFRYPYFAGLLSFAYLILVSRGGYLGAVSFLSASNATKEVVEFYKTQCDCRSKDNSDLIALPSTISGALLFTEKSWLKSHLELEDYPVCIEETACKLAVFTDKHNGLKLHAVHTSKLFLKSYVSKLKKPSEASKLKLEIIGKIKREYRRKDGFLRLRLLVSGIDSNRSGQLALSVNDQLLAVQNVHSKTENYFFSIDLKTLDPGSHSYHLQLVNDQSEQASFLRGSFILRAKRLN